MREALTLVFDFEWLNKTLFRSLYARTESFFDRSELSSHGRPADARERELLAPFASEVAPGIMEGEFGQPVTDGSGTNREGRKRAIALLEEAGYELRDGIMTSKANGAPFHLRDALRDLRAGAADARLFPLLAVYRDHRASPAD